MFIIKERLLAALFDFGQIITQGHGLFPGIFKQGTESICQGLALDDSGEKLVSKNRHDYFIFKQYIIRTDEFKF